MEVSRRGTEGAWSCGPLLVPTREDPILYVTVCVSVYLYITTLARLDDTTEHQMYTV
jgi:hypothetical protein